MNRYQPYGGYDNDTRRGGGYRGPPQQQEERSSNASWGAKGRARGGGGAPPPVHNNDYSNGGGGRDYRGGPGPDRHSRGGPPLDQDFRPPPQHQTYYEGPGSYDSRPPVYEQRPQEYGMQGHGYGYPPGSPSGQDQRRDDFRYNELSRAEDVDRRGPLKDHDAEGRKIEKRIAAERPCRVLFIRNVKYNSDGNLLREKFGAYGEMKGFFDLINTRGLVFVTYFDIRTAITARDALQGFEISNRPIDVHYSLPRDDDMPNRRCDRDRNQGTLRIMLRDGREPLQEFELDRMFRNFGAIKGIYFTGGDPAKERLLEFYDSRAMCDAYDRMQDVNYPGGGRLEIAFDWDVKDIPITNPPVGPLALKAAQERRGSSQPEPSYRGAPPPAAYQHQQPEQRRPPVDNYQSSNYDRRGPPEPPYQAAPPANPNQGYNPPPSAGNYGRSGPPPPAPYANQGPPPPSTPSYSYNNRGNSPPPANNYNQLPPNFPPPTPQYGQPPRLPPAPPAQPAYPQQAPADISNLLATLGDLPNGARGGGPPMPPPANNYARPPQPPPSFQPSSSSSYNSPSGPPSSSTSSYPPANYEPTPPQFPRPHEMFGASAPPSSASSSGPPPPAPPTPQMMPGGPPLPGDLLALLGQQPSPQNRPPHQSHQQTPSFEAPRTSPQRAPMQPFPMPPLPPQPPQNNAAPEAAGQQNQVNALLAMLKAQQH